MTLATPGDDATWRAALRAFLADSAFARAGAVMTDLDGTAVHEHDGRGVISPSVELGLKHVHDRGHVVIVNSLRFPLSVIRVFGAEWLRITGAAIPLVSLKGSLVGRLVPADGRLAFEELAATTLTAGELDEILRGVVGLVDGGVDDILVFYYPRDWRRGEIVWTPRADRAEAARRKYRSASEVRSGPVAELDRSLHETPVCMVFMMIDAPEDRLMAYQHTQRTSFFTHAGVDKGAGARTIAAALGVSLADSIGAGDAPPDNFLGDVGLAVIVGNSDLDYKGRRDTIRLPDSVALGRLLAAIG